MRFGPGAMLGLHLVFHTLDQQEAETIWRPLFDWIKASSGDFEFTSAPRFLVAPGRRFWDPAALREIPGLVVADDRPGAPAEAVFNAGDQAEAGQVLYAYQSVWLPAALLDRAAQPRLVEALVAAASHKQVSLHFNKGLAGGRPEAIEAARATAMNPAATEAFALAIIGAHGPPAYPGVPGHEPDGAEAKTAAAATAAAMAELRRIAPAASYVWETDYFEPDWRRSFWGDNYARPHRSEAEIRPRRPVLSSSRRRQRGVERRRVYSARLKSGLRRPRASG